MKNIKAYITSCRDQFIGELLAFCRQPSISTSGKGMKTMADMVAGRLARLGAEPQLLTVNGSYPFVFAEVGKGSRTLLVYDHYDVQPAHREDGWNHDPFAPIIREGRIFARGVADNKANLLFRIQAVEAYLAIYGELPLRVRFLVEGEEEIGSPHIARFVDENPELVSADGCVWESGRRGNDDRPVIHLGLRGILYVELSLQATNREIHSSWANVVNNPSLILLQRMGQVLSSLADSEGRPVFLLDIVPIPLQEDLDLLPHIPFSADIAVQEYGVTLRNELDGQEALRRLFFEPSYNINGVGIGFTERGIRTAIPNKAIAKLDFRLPPGLTPDLVESRLRSYLQTKGFGDVDLHRLVALRPARTSPRANIVKAACTAIQSVYKVEPVIYPLMPASGPMYDLCQVNGTPVITFGAGHPGDRVHSVHENIYLEDYFKALLGFVELLRQFAQS